MNKEEIKDYITELESMFELSELEEHRINILKVGIYINQLQQENQKYKEVIDKAIEYIDKHKENEYRNGRNDEIYLELNEKELKEFLEILKGE